ncbi:hypothetical protein [Kitasatospora sp. NPDC056731]|uniref:hypothetical protein n=1 Tax=Kitasatospora sp. NPDC056731 TaxID=3155422 RepID=UPI00342812DF
MSRRFAFTVTVADAHGRPVATVSGESVVTDDRRIHDQICQSIIDGLDSSHRRPGYRYSVGLRQL